MAMGSDGWVGVGVLKVVDVVCAKGSGGLHHSKPLQQHVNFSDLAHTVISAVLC